MARSRLFFAPFRAVNQIIGELAEWSKAHAWKVCVRQRTEGSNPSLSAKQASHKVQRSLQTRKFSNLVGFLLSCEIL
jgi:hypothetical protein